MITIRDHSLLSTVIPLRATTLLFSFTFARNDFLVEGYCHNCDNNIIIPIAHLDTDMQYVY